MSVFDPVLHLRLCGLLLVGLALLHIFLPRRFGWVEELQGVTLFTRQVFYVHMFFIALMVGLMGALALLWAPELVRPSSLGKAVTGGLAFFWAVRLGFQLFVYHSDLWRGKSFETSMHILFTSFWLYLTATFGWCFYLQTSA